MQNQSLLENIKNLFK